TAEEIFYRNTNDTAVAAVRNNDLVEMAFRAEPHSEHSFFPERFAASVENGKEPPYSYSIRTMAPFGISEKAAVETLPLHGFLGADWSTYRGRKPKSRFVSEAAEKLGMTHDEWLRKEFAPKLAKYSAEMNLKHGIYFEGHTQ